MGFYVNRQLFQKHPSVLLNEGHPQKHRRLPQVKIQTHRGYRSVTVVSVLHTIIYKTYMRRESAVCKYKHCYNRNTRITQCSVLLKTVCV